MSVISNIKKYTMAIIKPRLFFLKKLKIANKIGIKDTKNMTIKVKEKMLMFRPLSKFLPSHQILSVV
jgi:hypothetical protein